MTLEEAIKRYTDNAEYERTHGNLQGCLDFKQLAEWLRELKNYRKREFCRYCEEQDTLIFDEPCKSCKIRFVRKKVNADDSN